MDTDNSSLLRNLLLHKHHKRLNILLVFQVNNNPSLTALTPLGVSDETPYSKKRKSADDIVRWENEVQNPHSTLFFSRTRFLSTAQVKQKKGKETGDISTGRGFESHRARFSLNRATSHSAMLKKRGKEVKDISTCSRVRIQLVCRNSGWFDPDLVNCGFDG